MQLETWRILSIISCTKTNCPGLSSRVVCYVLRIPYVAVDITTVQLNSKYSNSSNPLVCTMFANFLYILSTI